MDVFLDASSFDPDVLFNDSLEVFEPINSEEVQMLSKPSQEVVKPFRGKQLKPKGCSI